MDEGSGARHMSAAWAHAISRHWKQRCTSGFGRQVGAADAELRASSRIRFVLRRADASRLNIFVLAGRSCPCAAADTGRTSVFAGGNNLLVPKEAWGNRAPAWQVAGVGCKQTFDSTAARSGCKEHGLVLCSRPLERGTTQNSLLEVNAWVAPCKISTAAC